MDKRLIHAVAGSGKTTYIVDDLDESDRSIVVTYTIANLRNIEEKIITKFGYVPSTIQLMSYESFLYSFCFIPFLGYKYRPTGMTFETPVRGPRQTNPRYYFSGGGRVFSNRAAKLVINEKAVPKVIRRLDKHFDKLYIDEVQDFAANDFNFLLALFPANMQIWCVGDFYQHTFDTSRDGSTRKNLYKNREKYLQEFKGMGLDIDCTTLTKSHRCSQSVCKFVTEKLSITIQSHREDQTRIELVEEKNRIDQIFGNDEIVKLFYKDHVHYPCFSNNWKKSKGIDSYGDVCIVLTEKLTTCFKSDSFEGIKETTKNALYVACTRARGNLYFVPFGEFDHKKVIPTR